MAKIVIAGAGLTGISTAYHLEQKNFFDYRIFEKEEDVGGLCGSVHQDGFTFDYTGHLLHISDPYTRKLITKCVGFEQFNTITRKSFIYSYNQYTPYPFQINLRGLPTQVISECIEGFVKRRRIKNPRTFIQWVNSSFGAGFGKHFFFPYQRKIFAYNLKQLTASWTGRFVPSTTLAQIIEGIAERAPEEVGYNAQFYYPKHGGIVSWVKRFAHHVSNPLMLKHSISKIDVKNKQIYFTNGHVESYQTLISTMPLDHLLGTLSGPKTEYLFNARNKLLCNKVINFNLGIAREALTDKHWIYFPEKDIPFYRLGFPHNFSQHMTPTGCSSLYGEFAHINKPRAWVDLMLKKSLARVRALFSLSSDEIVTEKIIPISHAYVIYDHWREKNIGKIHQRLNELGIYSIGRYGEWKYASMQEAILDGKKVVDSLLVTPAKPIGPSMPIAQKPSSAGEYYV